MKIVSRKTMERRYEVQLTYPSGKVKVAHWSTNIAPAWCKKDGVHVKVLRDLGMMVVERGYMVP